MKTYSTLAKFTMGKLLNAFKSAKVGKFMFKTRRGWNYHYPVLVSLAGFTIFHISQLKKDHKGHMEEVVNNDTRSQTKPDIFPKKR